MTEVEKIAYAKSFIDKLATGINPIDNQPVADDDLVNNVRVVRCLFYVSDILRQVIVNGGITPVKKKAKEPFSITMEQLAQFQFSETPVSISEITRKINALVDTEQMRRLPYKQLTGWLLSINALENQQTANRGMQKRPTEIGRQLGISLETHTGVYGDYQVVVYNKEAQEFILDNIDTIISFENKQTSGD